jgi:hypothetical protein
MPSRANSDVPASAELAAVSFFSGQLVFPEAGSPPGKPASPSKAYVLFFSYPIFYPLYGYRFMIANPDRILKILLKSFIRMINFLICK